MVNSKAQDFYVETKTAQERFIDTLEIPAPTVEHPGRTIALYKLPAKCTAQALAAMTGAGGSA